MHLDHVSKIDTRSELLVNMLLCWSKLPILGCLEMKLNKFILKPHKHLIIAESIGGEGALLQLETGCVLDQGSELVKVAVLVIQV